MDRIYTMKLATELVNGDLIKPDHLDWVYKVRNTPVWYAEYGEWVIACDPAGRGEDLTMLSMPAGKSILSWRLLSMD